MHYSTCRLCLLMTLVALSVAMLVADAEVRASEGKGFAVIELFTSEG